MSQIYNISSLIYYDNFKESYYPILTINKYPSGPLSSLIKQIKLEKLSPFTTTNTNYCEQNKVEIQKEVDRIKTEDKLEDKEVLDKIKKLFKNRYFQLIKNK